MRHTLPRTRALLCLAVGLLLTVAALPGLAQNSQTFGTFAVNPLVSDLSGVAPFTDPDLVNPWGMVEGTIGEVWTANNGTGTLTDFFLDGAPAGGRVVVPLPPGATGTAAPTGLVLNQTSGFLVSEGGRTAPARLIVATEEGTIAGWAPTVNVNQAILEVFGMYSPGTGPEFKGLAMARDRTGATFLYATDFRENAVNIYNSSWQLVKTFTDPTIPAGFAPFGIQNLNGHVWVTFALRGASGDDVAGPGNGIVDIFDVDGTLLRRFATGGPLNSPWGVAIPQQSFTGFSGVVLIGNFGDGTISLFDIRNGVFIGKLGQGNGAPLIIDGLWTLLTPTRPSFSGLPSFFELRNPNIFFTAGINGEADGLMGTIAPFRQSPFSFRNFFGTRR